LVLAMKNRGLYHTVISLVSYFFFMVAIVSGPTNQLCTTQTWDQLQKQTDLAVKIVQRDLQHISSPGVHTDLRESVYLLESIVQLLNVEVVIDIGKLANAPRRSSGAVQTETDLPVS
jgi:hypothetical protein